MKKAVKRALGLFSKKLSSLNLRRIRKKAKRHIFIDCGANVCKVLRDYIRKYPDFEFFAFEAQPELASEGLRVINENPDTKITFYNKAIWTNNETIDFYLASEWGPNYKGGSTLIHGHIKNSCKVDYSHPIKIDAIDFSEWLGRNFTPDDYVIIKMDIEGAEYDVIEKIIRDKNHDIIDELIVEFHQHMNESLSRERHNSLVKKIRSFCHLEIWH